MLTCAGLATLVYSKNPVAAPDDVVVKVINAPLPEQADQMTTFLWDTFANQPDEKKFGSYGSADWQKNYGVFSRNLVKKAGALNLNTESLEKVLQLVLKHSENKIAYLPVGAYQTTLNDRLVWIITVKWEYPSMGDDAGLGHIRMFVYDQKSLKRLGFTSCM